MIFNAGTSTVAQVLVQLCYTLQLRSVAVISEHESQESTTTWLKSLGATQVIPDVGSIKVRTIPEKIAIIRPVNQRRAALSLRELECWQCCVLHVT